MQVYDSLADVMGGTPLVRLKSVTRGVAPMTSASESYTCMSPPLPCA